VRREDTAVALRGGKLGNQGTAVSSLDALVTQTSMRLSGLSWAANRHAEALLNDTCQNLKQSWR